MPGPGPAGTGASHEPDRGSRPGTLQGRILALALSLVALTALATGLATVQFTHATAQAEQRTELTAQASLLTLQPGRLVTQRGLRRVAKGLDGTVLSVWDGSGSLLLTTAPGRRAAFERRTAAAARRAIAGADVSTSARVGGREMLVEARPTADGGAIVLARRTVAFTGTARTLAAGILVTLAACLALAAVAAVLLSRRITRPLAATAAAARRLASGERGVAVPEVAPAEVGDVADALRALDGALATSEGRQREFLLSISHELRTPLTALRGYGEALADGVVSGTQTREVGATLVAETSRLEHFTADLLELARLEADDFSVRPAEIDLAGVTAETVEAWQARADGLGVRLVREGLDAPLPARADARRVRQVVDGLVENALRATPRGGTVTLLGVRGAATAAIAVEDTGPGLSDDDLANAFTRGLLRERYRETRDVGTGLGLSIATRLAARMSGRVVAGRSATPPGARFTLELPRS